MTPSGDGSGRDYRECDGCPTCDPEAVKHLTRVVRGLEGSLEAAEDELASLRAEWPCANYTAPATCLLVGATESARCNYCRSQVFTCARCGGEANKHQGHYWSFCKVTNEFGEHHFCCPNDCELEARANEAGEGR